MIGHPEFARRHRRIRLHDPTRPKPAPMTVAQARGDDRPADEQAAAWTWWAPWTEPPPRSSAS